MTNQSVSGIEYTDRITGERRSIQPFRYPTKNGTRTGRKAILFGSNGAGKTTLGTSIESTFEEDSLRYLDDQGAETTEPSLIPHLVNVFNEGSIRNIAQFSSDGLGAIVLLGEQIETEGNLKRKQAELKNGITNKDYYDSLCKTSAVRKGELLNAIEKILKSEHGWSVRQKRIRQLQNKARVSINELLPQLYKIDDFRNGISLEESLDQFDNELQGFLTESSTGEVRPIACSEIDFEKLQEIANACAKAEDENHTGNLETSIIPPKVAASKSSLKEAKTWFESLESDKCPNCYQEIDHDHKSQVMELIDLHLSALDETPSLKIPSYRFPSLDYDSEDYEGLNLDLDNINSSIRELTEEIDKFESSVSAKVDSPGAIISIDLHRIRGKYDTYRKSVSNANVGIAKFNQRVKSVLANRKRLEEANLKIAALEAKEEMESYAWAELVNNCANNQFRKSEHLVSSIESEIRDLESARNNTLDAADRVNHYLSLVFYSQNRLYIAAGENNYAVYSKGKRVSPSQLSTGERNIIALCYFFVSINSGLPVKKFFSTTQLIIIDDPLSSFDGDNKYGVFSFLVAIFREILDANSENKVIVMTHDFTLSKDFERAFNNIPGESSPVQRYLNGELSLLKTGEADVYLSILHSVYGFASLTDDKLVSEPMLAANAPRRLIEAFFHFLSGENVSDFTVADSVLGVVREREPSLVEYFKNAMLRLYLHPESHSAEQVSSGNFTLTPSFNSSEVRRMCRDVLVLIDIESPAHITGRIGTKKTRGEIRSNLSNWRSNTPST
ncbi:AAA family ATPase [Corynebacterium variabile]|uniref:AAA family ATPase n=1 Tax=Corynebacterium variabile TaxID=1727 RepID=UPI003FD57FA7